MSILNVYFCFTTRKYSQTFNVTINSLYDNIIIKEVTMNIDLVDLVNEKDEVIGTIDRNNSNFIKYKNVRGVEAFLITNNNKIIIPKRSSNRRIYPNCYDYSVAGMVDSKEDYEEAIYRELKEELGIDNIELKEIAYFNPYKSNSPMFIKLYVGYIGFEIKNYDKDGISKLYYLTVEEINKLLKENINQFKGTFSCSFAELKSYLKNKMDN